HRTHCHITGRHWDVGIPTQIVWWVPPWRREPSWALFQRDAVPRPLAILHSVVALLTEGKPAHCALGVVRDSLHIGWEEALIKFVNVHSNIGPPQECLSEWSSVVEAHLDFDIRSARIQAYTMCTLKSVHWLMVTTPNGACSVMMFFDLRPHRHER